MSEKQKAFIVLAIVSLFWLVVGGFCGFFIGRTMCNHPIEESVTLDTVVRYDTIPQYYPKPVEVERVRTEYQWLPIAKITHDTVGFTQFVHDSVLVEVPITSKHYHGENYDAYVSGYQPSLDSISVFQRTEYITETITRMKPPNKWEFDIIGGINYATSSQHWLPYAGGELMLNRDKRLQLGIEGGMMKEPLAKQWTPFAGAKVRIKVL